MQRNPLQRHHLLWVEDETQHEMQGFVGPLYAEWKYDIDLAIDASQALARLRQKRYDAVIVDIRIPPGEDECWQEIYNLHGADPSAAKLGLVLLEFLFGQDENGSAPKTRLKLNGRDFDLCRLGGRPESNLDPSRFGVFSVESNDLEDQLSRLGVGKALAKRARTPRIALVELIDEILALSRSE